MTVNNEEGYHIVQAPPELWSDLLDKGWFDHERENRKQGFGEGADGRLHGLSLMLDLAKRSQDNPDLEVFSIRPNGTKTNVGFVAAESLGEQYKTAQLFVYVEPEHRKSGIFRFVVEGFLEALFRSGIYRVQGDVLRINREAITAARALGFTWESTRKQGMWMDGHPHDVATLRILKADWKKRRKAAKES
jgi:RimJ/RimL family protein N-acetyltransferase